MTKNLFDKTACEYDFLNNIISLYTHKLVKKIALSHLNIKDNLLDLCCGSGDLGAIIKKQHPECKVVGVDFSQEMLKIAKQKNPNITYIEADAQNLQFNSNSFNTIVMGFGLRNIKDKTAAINEIYRVLDNEGEFLHLDFGQKNIFSKIYDCLVLLFSQFFAKNKESYHYLVNSKREFYAPCELIEIFNKAGFKCKIRKGLLFGIISFQIFQKEKAS